MAEAESEAPGPPLECGASLQPFPLRGRKGGNGCPLLPLPGSQLGGMGCRGARGGVRGPSSGPSPGSNPECTHSGEGAGARRPPETRCRGWALPGLPPGPLLGWFLSLVFSPAPFLTLAPCAVSPGLRSASCQALGPPVVPAAFLLRLGGAEGPEPSRECVWVSVRRPVGDRGTGHPHALRVRTALCGVLDLQHAHFLGAECCFWLLPKASVSMFIFLKKSWSLWEAVRQSLKCGQPGTAGGL